MRKPIENPDAGHQRNTLGAWIKVCASVLGYGKLIFDQLALDHFSSFPYGKLIFNQLALGHLSDTGGIPFSF